MKKTKLLTSVAALALVLGLGACSEPEEEENPIESDSSDNESTPAETITPVDVLEGIKEEPNYTLDAYIGGTISDYFFTDPEEASQEDLDAVYETREYEGLVWYHEEATEEAFVAIGYSMWVDWTSHESYWGADQGVAFINGESEGAQVCSVYAAGYYADDWYGVNEWTLLGSFSGRWQDNGNVEYLLEYAPFCDGANAIEGLEDAFTLTESLDDGNHYAVDEDVAMDLLEAAIVGSGWDFYLEMYIDYFDLAFDDCVLNPETLDLDLISVTPVDLYYDYYGWYYYDYSCDLHLTNVGTTVIDL